VQIGGIVWMGNNFPCDVIIMDTIQIKKFDGVVHTLIEVQHVPSMSRNLILLNTLDIKEYKYYAGDGVMKVTKGSLVVMKGDLKSANLYVLRGSSFSLKVVVAPDSELLKFGICVLSI
jgi:hypothetical protein